MKNNKGKTDNKQKGISYKYALCLVDVPHLGTKTFSYLIPESLKNEIKIGHAVLLPFGKRKDNIVGFVVGFSDYLEEGITAKEIIKVIDKRSVFSLNYLKLMEWVANYYCCDINYVLQAAVPMKFLRQNSNNKQKTKTKKYVIYKTKENAPKKHLRILEFLEKIKEEELIKFEKEVKTTRNTVKKLFENGYIDIVEKEVYRNPLSIFKNIEKDDFPELSYEQEKAFEKISERIDKKQADIILLNGITGSGKTEIYFKAIQKVLDEGRNVLFLEPEIALASQITLRLIKRFNPDEIAIWHSSISDGKKYDVWNKLRDNKIRIIIGARSSIFAPLNNIGLVIIDEEHENAYKQITPSPKYDARKVAEKICEINNALLLKGSATPDINSYFDSLSKNNLITLNKRFNDVELAKVSIVNMNEEFYKDTKSIFSNLLINNIKEELKKKKQIILLMNRRGFYTSVYCKSCSEVIKCPNCDIPMVYHKEDNTLKCHWCDSTKSMPKTCPKCGSSEIITTGMGTQRIEEIVSKLFPDAKAERIDSDVLKSKTKYIEIMDRFQKGETDILIGTQMIAKGMDNKNVTLVGVIDADVSFAFPDYRSNERGFQLLMQVAGRAGRGENEGKVIFQTDNPELYAIKNAKSQNYSEFYENEINRRELFDYPPFCQIIKIVISSYNEIRALECAQKTYDALLQLINKHGLSEYIEITPALKCIMYKINKEYRYQIIIKNKLEKKGQYFISTFFKSISTANDIKIVIDVDPVDVI